MDPPAQQATDWPARAVRLLDAEPGASPPEDPRERLALAWAIKDACYAAWTSKPRRAAAAAELLCDLRVEGDAAADPAAREIDALAHWTDGIAQLTRGHMAEAARGFEQAADRFRALGQPHHAAQTQVPRIMALSMLGQLDEAAACGERTLAEFLEQGDRRAAGKVSLNLGSLQMRRDAYAPAARHYRDAAVFFARVGDHEHSVMADGGLADALTSMGDFDEALRIYARARMRAQRHDMPVTVAMIDESVALLALARGRLRDALAGFESSRQCYERLDMPQHLAIAEKQLADAYLELRLLPEAVALFDRALVTLEALDMPVDRAWTLAQRGRAQALLSMPPAARASFADAAALFEAHHNHVGEAAVALARAELALAEGEHPTALARSAQAASAFDAAGRPDGRLRAEVVQAHAQLEGGQVEAARAQFQATLKDAGEQQLTTVQVRCLVGQGLVARAQADDAAAGRAFEAAIELFEDQRRALPGDEIRSAFLSDHLRPYQELLGLALQSHARAPTTGTAQSVLVALDRMRARSLSERLAEPTAAEDDAASSALRARLNWLYRRTRRLEDDDPPPATLRDEALRIERELLEHARRQRLAAPPKTLAAEGSADEALDVQALCAQLGAHDALVAYGVLDDELFACVVDASGVQVRRHLARWADVLEAWRTTRFQIDTLRHGSAPVLRHLDALTERTRQRLKALHARVWAPLASDLAGARQVLIVPHGPLGALPFAALDDGEQVLAQRHELAMVPSVRLALRGLRRPPNRPDRALVLGESSRLPHAAHEARAVASHFAASVSGLDAQASMATLKAHAGEADVIHLACHAEFRSDNPMFSALHLADGALTVEQAQGLRLKPAVVVLSACETGLSEATRGDEMFGLVRAFLVAGAARVVASLWPVDDAITGFFMARFYTAWRGGQGLGEALRSAQLQTRQAHPHPAHWAAFSLHGGGSPTRKDLALPE